MSLPAHIPYAKPTSEQTVKAIFTVALQAHSQRKVRRPNLDAPHFLLYTVQYGRAPSRLLHDMPQQRMPASRELPQAVVCNEVSCGRSVSPRAQPAALSEGKRRMRALPPDEENPSYMGDKRHAARHSLRSRAEHKTGHDIPFRENPILPILSRGNSAHSRRVIRGSKHFPP